MSPVFCLFFITQAAIFQGRVIDAATREQVPYVQIEVLPLGLTVLTDSAGIFRLEAAELPARVAVSGSRVGYEPRVWNEVGTAQAVTLFLLPRAIPVAGVTSTATRLRLKPEVCLPVTVIENEPSEPKGRVDISGLIGLAPGVLIQDYGNLSTISLRGASAEQTLVMLDGVRLNFSLNNQADLTLISTDIAQRIEVVRGGTSALYGASSIGGVINIITPPVTRLSYEASIGLGSFGKRYAGVSLKVPGSIDYSVSGSFIRADNRFRFRDSLDSVRVRTNAALTRASILFKSGVKLAGRQHLSFSASFCDAVRGSPGPVSFPSESARLDDNRLLLVTGYDIQESDNARLSARFFHQRMYQEYHNRSEYFAANDTHQVNRTGFNLSQRLNCQSPVLEADAVLGFDADYEQAKSTTVGRPARLSGAVYLETGIGSAGFSLGPAFRYELIQNLTVKPESVLSGQAAVVSSYGAFSPKLALIISRFQPLSFYLSVNRSFRNPTFNELWWPADAWTRGNPKLLPEWATGWDGGAGLKLGRVGLVRTGVFHSRVTNLIQWQPDENFVYQPVNIARATITGLEFEPRLELGWIGLAGSCTWQVCRAETTDLPYRPRFSEQGTLWFAYPSDSGQIVRITFSGRGFSSRWTNQENTEQLSGTMIFDAGASLRMRLKPVRAVLNLGCQNLFDRGYQTIKGYPVPGRGFYLETAIGI